MEHNDAYDNNLEATELRLGLPGTDRMARVNNKRPLSDARAVLAQRKSMSLKKPLQSQSLFNSYRVQIVGWPPVRSYRKNSMSATKKSEPESGIYVKVSMDGAPYLRKIDLKVYKGYSDLRQALDDMFKGFATVDSSGKEGSNGCESTMTYEDKDGDWMLVGDVPWEMFISSCKRLRIMKGLNSSP
ncbi:Auxin-responsive protein IAA4 [Acorus calamus]|uniref:Auxin-responsive protein n=1 Tax=Acorus calamus TaxID=4465 RepID=A0AAV9CHX2_ACOCL|nr:Auxin-responsive protein IAA4 [Acorus calamus]